MAGNYRDRLLTAEKLAEVIVVKRGSESGELLVSAKSFVGSLISVAPDDRINRCHRVFRCHQLDEDSMMSNVQLWWYKFTRLCELKLNQTNTVPCLCGANFKTLLSLL